MTSPTVRGGPDEPRRLPAEVRSPSRLTGDLLEAVAYETGDRAATPGALSRAAAQVLPVDGVGISTLAGGLRMPLGTSSASAELAEELETTLGDGPCLAAAQARTACLADLPELLRHWPVYTESLTRRTGYRSAAAIPLLGPDGQVFAALDLYTEDPGLGERLAPGEVASEIGASLGALLDVCLRPVRAARFGASRAVLPEWYEDATLRRLDVWVAIGMVAGCGDRRHADVLSLVRGYAYSHERTLDELAEDIVLGRLAVERVLG